MNIDEKFLFVKSFDVVYVLDLIETGLGFFLGWFGSHEKQFYIILKFYKIRIHWLVLHPVTILSPMTNFESSD